MCDLFAQPADVAIAQGVFWHMGNRTFQPCQRGEWVFWVLWRACYSVLSDTLQGRPDEHRAMRTGCPVGRSAKTKEIFINSKPQWVPELLPKENEFVTVPI